MVKYGFSTALLPLSKKFLHYAASTPGMYVDMGCGSGFLIHAAMHSHIAMIGVDISYEELQKIHFLYSGALEKILLIQSRFPQEIEIKENSIQGIHLGRILHFLDGEEIEFGLSKIFAWLKQGGKLFTVNVSPYWRRLKSVKKLYDLRKKSGERWPGYVENFFTLCDFPLTNVPAKLHALDIDVLSRALKKANFTIDSAYYYPRWSKKFSCVIASK